MFQIASTFRAGWKVPPPVGAPFRWQRLQCPLCGQPPWHRKSATATGNVHIDSGHCQPQQEEFKNCRRQETSIMYKLANTDTYHFLAICGHLLRICNAPTWKSNVSFRAPKSELVELAKSFAPGKTRRQCRSSHSDSNSWNGKTARGRVKYMESRAL